MDIETNIDEVNFNISKALIIIENDEDLNEMFREKYNTDYRMCHTLINSGVGIKPKAEEYIKALFEKVILESSRLRNAYKSLILEKSEGVTEETSKKSIKKKKRWGLQAISDDITKNFDGKPIQIHKTAKKVQSLKKLYVRLETRTYNERFTAETLTDSQLRELGGAIEMFDKKVQSILNPKK